MNSCYYGNAFCVFQNGEFNLTLPSGQQGVLLLRRWVNILKMFEISGGAACCVFRSYHQTQTKVLSFPSMLLNMITS